MKSRSLGIALTAAATLSAPAKDAVVLLHGLARSPKSMKKMEKALAAEGYQVVNLGYPSRQHTVEDLSAFVSRKVAEKTGGAEQVHFVTHSLGGILVRHIQTHRPIGNIGRTVMLSPPNHGSEVVDKLRCLKAYQWINGPVGQELGTGPDGVAAMLKPVTNEVGVLTGSRSINWINSLMIPGKDDGKVSVASAEVEGMKDYKVMPASHPFIMKKKAAINEVIAFLKNGEFTKE